MVLFSCLPLALVYKSNENRSVLDMAYEISPLYSKIRSVLYILLFLFYAFSTLSRLDLFSGTVIFRESDTKVFVVLSVLLALSLIHIYIWIYSIALNPPVRKFEKKKSRAVFSVFL